MRLLVIGCGKMGEYHIKKFSKLGATVTGAMDRNLSKLERFKAKYNLEFICTEIDDIEKFSDKFDAISIALVDSLHLFAFEKIAKFHFPVFMEKPLSLNLEQAKVFTKYDKVPVMMNFSKRNFGGLHLLKNYYKNNDLGSLISVKASYLQSWTKTYCWGDYHKDPRWKWRLNPEVSCYGCLGDLGSHVLDSLIYIFEQIKFSKTLETKTLTEQLFRPKENNPIYTTCKALFKTNEDVPIEIYVSNEADKDDELKIELIFDKGRMVFNNNIDRNQIKIIQDGKEKIIISDKIASTYELFINLVDDKESNSLNLDEGILVQGFLERVVNDASDRSCNLC